MRSDLRHTVFSAARFSDILRRSYRARPAISCFIALATRPGISSPFTRSTIIQYSHTVCQAIFRFILQSFEIFFVRSANFDVLLPLLAIVPKSVRTISAASRHFSERFLLFSAAPQAFSPATRTGCTAFQAAETFCSPLFFFSCSEKVFSPAARAGRFSVLRTGGFFAHCASGMRLQPPLLFLLLRKRRAPCGCRRKREPSAFGLPGNPNRCSASSRKALLLLRAPPESCCGREKLCF